MSFMFNPYPYDDPNAFNVLDPSGLTLSELVEGSGASAAAEAAKAAGALKRAESWVIAVDGYSTAPLGYLPQSAGAAARSAGDSGNGYGR